MCSSLPGSSPALSATGNLKRFADSMAWSLASMSLSFFWIWFSRVPNCTMAWLALAMKSGRAAGREGVKKKNGECSRLRSRFLCSDQIKPNQIANLTGVKAQRPERIVCITWKRLEKYRVVVMMWLWIPREPKVNRLYPADITLLTSCICVAIRRTSGSFRLSITDR